MSYVTEMIRRVWELILLDIKNGMTVRQVCSKYGVSHQTVYRAVKMHNEAARALARAKRAEAAMHACKVCTSDRISNAGTPCNNSSDKCP